MKQIRGAETDIMSNDLWSNNKNNVIGKGHVFCKQLIVVGHPHRNNSNNDLDK